MKKENIKSYFLATRPWSFTMSFFSYMAGTFLALKFGSVSWSWFFLGFIGLIFIHGGANVLNDYFDTKNKIDTPDSATAIYRPHPIFQSLLNIKQLSVEAAILLGLGLVIGLLLVYFRSLTILWIGMLGFFGAFFYSGWPINYKYRAFGELAVFLIWGPLIISGAYLIQQPILTKKLFYIVWPLGLWVALVLLANNTRDIDNDKKTSIHTLGTILGEKKAYLLFSALICLLYIYILIAILLGIFSPFFILVFLSLPKSFKLIKDFKSGFPVAADADTAKAHTIFGVLFILALFLEVIFCI